MGTPIDLGKIFGVQVRVDLTVLLVAALFVYTGLPSNPDLRDVLDQVTFVILLFVSIFLHEMGHAAGAALFGIRTLDVTLTFFGGYARLDHRPRHAIADIVVSFAGPATNLAIAGLLYLWLTNGAAGLDYHSRAILSDVQWMNLVLGVLNLLPGYPLDGGHIARAVLATFLPPVTARLIVGYIGVAIGFLFVGLDLAGGISFGLMIGFLLIYVASIEIQAARSSRF